MLLVSCKGRRRVSHSNSLNLDVHRTTFLNYLLQAFLTLVGKQATLYPSRCPSLTHAQLHTSLGSPSSAQLHSPGCVPQFCPASPFSSVCSSLRTTSRLALGYSALTDTHYSAALCRVCPPPFSWAATLSLIIC